MQEIGYVILCIVLFATLGGCVGLIIYRAKKDSENDFSCPNCGEFFQLNWKKLIPVSITYRFRKYARLRCPRCNQKDYCKMHYDDEL